MEIQTEIVDGKAIIRLSGRVESGAVDELKTTIQRLLDDGHREFVVHLERVPYIDSETVGAIVRAYTDVSRRGGRLKLEGLTQRVRELLRLSELIRPFEAGGLPSVDPLNPRLEDNYPKAAIATAGLILVVVVVSVIIWATR